MGLHLEHPHKYIMIVNITTELHYDGIKHHQQPYHCRSCLAHQICRRATRLGQVRWGPAPHVLAQQSVAMASDAGAEMKVLVVT